MDLDRPVSTLGGVHPLLQPGVNRLHVCLHFIYCGTHCSHHLSGLHHCETNSRGIQRQTQSYFKTEFSSPDLRNITYVEGGEHFGSWKLQNEVVNICVEVWKHTKVHL